MIDINKQYRTRDGREVRIYATDGGGPCPVHGAILGLKFWSTANWSENGSFSVVYGEEHDADLIEVKPRIKQKMWVNVYPDHCLGAYHEKKHADEMAAPHRIGCVQVEIDIEEGEGL
jgi:hypothetical protein